MDNLYIKKELNDLACMAIAEIATMKQPVIQFCAPVSTGGLGSTKDNISNLESFIDHCEKSGMSVFNQMKYEDRMDKILENHVGYDYPILDFFYRPIFESKLISGLVFLPLWESSVGCRWEHDFANNNSIPICILSSYLDKEVINFYNKLCQ